ncbi:hypothetical protein Avbf_08120 [Armadillidium vulgare]|nr:hypothetical protein Avbf_08120 [Armadillidium vulgare]
MKKVESGNTPKTVSNINKFGGNTPKQGKLHQQKTPQKDSKSPQSVLNIPKTPDSNSKKRKRNQTQNDNKKQKVDNSKEVILIRVLQLQNLLLGKQYERKIFLKKQEDKEKVQKFYNPKSIEMLLTRNGDPSKCYLLTFETEKEAIAASKKPINLNNKNLFLINYLEDLEEKSIRIGKVEGAKQAHKQNQNQPKQAKNAQKQKLEQKNNKSDEESVDDEDDEMKEEEEEERE